MAEKVQRQTLAFLWILDYIIIMWLRKITRWAHAAAGKSLSRQHQEFGVIDVKETEWCVFVREYSALPGLQRAGAVRYALAQQGTQLCLTAQRFDAAGRAEGGAACCLLTGVERPAAERLLRYLYGNSVEPAAMRDVVADCLDAALQPAGSR